MSFTPNFEVYGVAAAIKELGRIDPELAKAAKARIKEAAEPLANAARRFTPTAPPLSRWKATPSGRTPGWEPGRARTGIKTKVSTSAPRGRRIQLAAVVQGNPAGAMFDMAGKATSGRTPQGRAFVRNVTDRYGAPSRAMWRATVQTTAQVEDALRTAVADIETLLARELGEGR